MYINDQSYELNKIINKDVLWFFIKLVLQKITKTHDNICCALTPRHNVLQEKTITWTKGALHIYLNVYQILEIYNYYRSIYALVYHLLG